MSSNPFRYLRFATSIIFIGLGLFFLLQPHFLTNMSFNQQKGFGILLALYGAYRFYRTIKQRQNADPEQ